MPEYYIDASFEFLNEHIDGQRVVWPILYDDVLIIVFDLLDVAGAVWCAQHPHICIPRLRCSLLPRGTSSFPILDCSSSISYFILLYRSSRVALSVIWPRCLAKQKFDTSVIQMNLWHFLNLQRLLHASTALSLEQASSVIIQVR